MTTTLLIPKPVQSNPIDLALCKRLAQEARRRASATESWATLIFGRLNRQQCALQFARELAELAEKDAAELRQLTAALVYELQSGGGSGDANGNAELKSEFIYGRGQRRHPWTRPLC
jgi:hypothetical protein